VRAVWQKVFLYARWKGLDAHELLSLAFHSLNGVANSSGTSVALSIFTQFPRPLTSMGFPFPSCDDRFVRAPARTCVIAGLRAVVLPEASRRGVVGPDVVSHRNLSPGPLIPTGWYG
jgi:hypothetical protein